MRFDDVQSSDSYWEKVMNDSLRSGIWESENEDIESPPKSKLQQLKDSFEQLDNEEEED